MIQSRPVAHLKQRLLPVAVLALFFVSLFANVGGVSAAPLPSVPSLGNQDAFIGDPAAFSFNFSNTGPNTGYGPFIELALDSSGPDGASTLPLDGYGSPSMTVAGLSLSPVATIPVVGATFTNPLTGDVRPVPAGFGVNDTIYIYVLPFGSFTPGQTTLTVTNVPTSNRADLNVPLPIAITPGFRDDTPALNGPAIYGTTSTGTITPLLYRLKKTYIGPEDETATGPNFPRRYRLEVDVATGQTVTNLVVTDNLAASMQIIGRNTINMFAAKASSGLSTNVFVAGSSGGTAITTAPDGTLTYNFGGLTGVDGVDAVFEFDFYVPRDDSTSAQVVPQLPLASPTSGTDSTLATNSADSRLDWTPIDSPRDPAQTNLPPAVAGSILTHQLEQHSLAIQKIGETIDPATGNVVATGQIVPGTALIRYTINFQVSDYYAVKNIRINDVLGDGLRLFTGNRGAVTAGLPTLSIKNAYLTGSPSGSRTNLAAGPFGGGSIAYERRYTLQSALPAGTSSDPTSFPGAGPTDPAFVSTVGGTINGSTLLNFDISAELTRRLGANAGRLVGGEINNNGTGPDNDPFAGPNLGGTTGQIVFYAEVSQDFSDDFPSSDRSVDQGDLLNNTVNDPLTAGRDGIIAEQIRPADINAAVPTIIGSATDDSAAGAEIGYGAQSKTINRINGQPVPVQAFFNPPFSVQPGDRITYKLTYTLPINSYEQLRITDFPPLPVMPVGSAAQYSFEGNTPTYGAHTIAIAPDDTFFSTVGFIGPNVQAATTAALGGATFNPTGGIAGNGAFTGAPTTIDGVALVAGNLVLVKDQADPHQNGVYQIVSAGTWQRDSSMDLELEVESSRLIRAVGGTVNTGVDFVQSNNQFSQFNGPTTRGDLVFVRFISTDQPNNGILLNFGNFDDPLRRSGTVSLLLTLPVGNDPFGADLFLTNQLRVNEASTNNGTTTVEEVRRFELVRPTLTIQKGVVGANTTGFTLGGIVFSNPSLAANFTGGPIDTAAEANAIGARNIGLTDAVDAGDKIRYAIVAQNTGKGDAFDVVLRDVIPAQYNRATFNPATDLVLRHGDATQLATSVAVDGFVRLATTTALVGTYNPGPSNGEFTNVPRQISAIDVDLNDRVLVKDQATASQNGIYTVSAIDLNTATVTLTRAADADTAAELSGYDVAVAGDSAANDHYQAGAVATINASAVNWGAALGVVDYYTFYTPSTGELQILLSDTYSAGNINSPIEDNRSGSISRGKRTDQTLGDQLITNGSNTVVALYDVTLQNTVTPNQVIPNTATIPTYANSEGGQDLTNPSIISGATDPSDSASVTVRLPLMAKTLVSTEVTAPGNNVGTQATIGELVTYQVTLTVPEGTTPTALITDTLSSGLAFVDVTSVSFSAGVSAVTTPGIGTTPANTTIAAVGGQNGRRVSFNFGTITNTDTNNAVAESITIIYRAIVLNTNGAGGTANNQTAQTRNNSAQLGWFANGTTVAAVSAGRATSTAGTASGTATPVTIVEPTLTNLKDVRNVTQGETFPVAAGTPQTTRGDAGDTMQYRITIQNGAASSSTTANDVTLSDPLPISFFTGGVSAFSVGGVTVTGAGQVRRDGVLRVLDATDFAISGAGLLSFNTTFNYDIDPDVIITLLINGTNFTGATGQLVDNIADLRWTSLDGTPGTRSTYNTNSTERTGADGEISGGTLNDYRDTDNAVIESPPIVRKTIVTTSEASTAGSNVAVGEIVRFRLVASVAEGTAGNFQIQDFLPTGMSFINDGTARWALVSTGGNTIASTSVPVVGVPSLGSPIAPGTGGIDGDQTTVSAIASSAISGTFADANISTDANGAGTGDAAIYADGADVFFRFGSMANTDNDTNVEYAIVEFNALVRNQVSNQAGTVLNNRLTILADTNGDNTAGYIDVVTDANGDGVGTGEATVVANDAANNAAGTPAQSAPTPVTVVEPNLQINKQVIATTGGIVTYRVTLTNPAGANATTGFDIHVLDALNAVNFSRTSLAAPTITLAGGATGSSDASAGNTIDITIDTLPVGGSVVIEYQANVLVTPTGATTLDNTANATFTSLPGISGTGGTWAGINISSTVPGAASSATGERTGADGVGGALNDYAIRDSEQLGSLGDRVYFDANGDGVQDVGEAGILGVTVTVTWAGLDGNLATAGDNSIITVVTGANGNWTVTGLPIGGLYQVSVPATVSGMSVTDAVDNGTLTASNTANITLTVGTPNPRTQDFGYRGTATLGNRIYIDANGNGIQDANGLEPSLPGVVTTLTWAGPDAIFGNADDLTFTQNATNAATNYLYTNLPAGDFRVAVSPTGGTGGVPDNTTLTDALDNGGAVNTNPDGLGAGTIQTNLTTGENELTIDFGYRGTASIGDYVWYDADGDGVQDVNETGIPGATVTLLWSGADGNFATTGDNVTFTTTTDASGLYLFPSLPVTGAGSPYRVTVTPLAAYPTQTFDSDGLGSANASTYTLAPAEDNRTQDFGYRGTAQLGNLVWEDQNGNGRQDGEPGIDNVSVSLFFDNNNDGDFGDAGEGTAIATTTTAGGGLYSFTNLASGNYQVVFSNSNGVTTYTRTVADSVVATDASDSDAAIATGRTSTYTLANGANNQTVDAGLYTPITLGDRVYYDLNGDGVQNASELGITGVTITVVWLGPDGVLGGGDDQTFSTITGVNGIWSVTNLPPGNFQVTSSNAPAGLIVTDSIDNGTLSATNPVTISATSGVDRNDIDFGYRGLGAIGDRVFLDVNANGVYDAGEGIDGVTVTLVGDLNGDGVDDTLTTTTATDGFYQFTNLRTTIAGLPYTVTVNTAQIPQDGAGNPLPNTADPDTAGTGNSTSALDLATGAPSNQLQDFGYRGLGQIGDTIFLDANSNNLPDAGEGITGVSVTLSGDIDGDGTAETFTTTTNASGIYDFSNLPVRTPAGALISYTVTVDTTTLPSTLTNTVDPDTANPGDSTSTLTLPIVGAPQNLAQDFGYRGAGTIGDQIFLDINNNGAYDIGEGIANVTVTLTADLNGDGINETLSTTTDADGFYQFANLPIFQRDGTTAVSYTVAVVTATLPTGVTNTVDPDGGLNNTSALTLSVATPSNQAQDFGYRGAASLGDRVWLDANGDGVQDAGTLEPGLPGVTMQLTWAGPDGTFGNADDITSAIATDNTGLYIFNGLPAGTFRVNAVPAGLASNLAQTYDLDGLATANQADRALALGEAATNVDFGYRSNASVGNRVWLDQNSDGIQDPTEVGVSGATVQVTWYGTDGTFGTADDIVFTTTTGANGAYLVDGLPANALVGLTPNYRVAVTALPITGLTLTDSLDNAALNAINPIDIQVSPIDGDPLNDRRDVDFGYDGASSLAGTVYRDDNNNGVQDVGELGIGSVTLTLTGVDVFGNPYLNPLTNAPYQVTTDSNGDYLFATVVPGTYTITESQPANYNDGIDTAGSLGGNAGNDLISGILVGANQTGVEYNFGEIGTFLAGVVFRDDNRDGVLDPVEATRLPGVTVELYDSTGVTLLATTATGPDGSYRFDHLAIGSYQIRETQPVDYLSSPVGPFAPNTRSVNVPAAGLADQNFGEILARISGVVYVDANNDGGRGATDTVRIGNVPVTLAGTDINGAPVNITVFTNPSGAYRFDNLFPADATGYTITEGSAAPYSDRAANPGTGVGGAVGSAATVNSITGIGLTAGNQGINYDFGEVLPAQPFISGSVYRDDSRDGIRDSIELPIAGVTITLYDAGADGIFGNADDGPTLTTPTDSAGNYLFPNLTSGHNYRIVETQPAAYGNSPVGPTVFIAVNSLPATGSTNNNYGEVLGSLAGAVYFDANNNGSRDAGEQGIAGTTVTLTGTDVDGNPVNLTATTAADGSYRFDNLATGNYTVTETQPAAYSDGGETVGSAGGILSANDVISAIPLGAGVNATSYNFGEINVSVSGLVFHDANRDGSQNVGENPIAGVTIQLVDSTGAIIATTTTKPDGSYLFPNVAPGSYTITEIQPTGYGDPLVGPFAPNSRPITVVSTAITNQNFGDTLSTLAGNVYVDNNNNGLIDGADSGISGVTVRLDWAGSDGIFGNADDISGQATTITGVNGSYLFSDLRTGVYRVVEPTQPAPYSDGRETPGAQGGNIGTNEQISDIPIAAGVDLTDYNFGELAPVNSFISGSVYIDTNNNGTRDPGEPGIPGTTVTLTDGINPPVIVTTDSNGNYLFPNLTPGVNYTITETQPASYGNGLENPGNVITVAALPVAGSTNNNYGELPGTISGIVYYDADNSGVLSVGDVRIPGVTLTLQNSGGTVVTNPLTGLPYVLTSAADGSYLFENLPAGNYTVIETQPAGYNDGAETPGVGNTSTINDQIAVVLPAGGNSPDNNYGELGTSLSGTVWIDTNRDGALTGETGRVAGVTIRLIDSNGNQVATTITNPTGDYSFGNLLPGNYTVVEDQPNIYGSTTPNTLSVSLTGAGSTGNNFGEVLGSLAGQVYADLNNNGIREGSEPGIPGTTVTLTGTDVNGNPITQATITAADGSYSFTDLPTGSYQTVETQPAGFSDGLDQAGTAGGSIAINDQISSIPLGAGVNATEYNFGEIGVSISGRVWLDRNRDTILDPTEPGIGGVTIELRDSKGALIATTTTNPDGTYVFTGLAAGVTYTITELQPNTYGSSTPNVITTPIVPSTGLTDQNFGETLGRISGSVFIDINDDGIRNPGESGIPGTTITLTGTDLNGNPISRTITTDSNGNYTFIDLPAGSYTVVETQPANHGDGRDSLGNAGGTLTNDQATGITVIPGGDATDYDFGENPLTPTAVALASFTATHEANGVMVRWETIVELNSWGFQLYRSTNGNRTDAQLITPEQIAATGRGQGASYEWLDTNTEPGVTYTYWLVETELSGQANTYGPVRSQGAVPAGSEYRLFLPEVSTNP